MHRSLIAISLLVAASAAFSQKPSPKPPRNPDDETPAQFAARTKWWREAKFGMFIHWGVYAVPADSTTKDGHKAIAEWYYSNKQMPMDEYQKFAAQFNPVNFDAHKWVATAKAAGMKYIVITSKHHDGFDMFGTKLNHDWNIVDATPFKRDPLKELAEECRKQGIRFCTYHSIMDWHHFDYLPRRPWDTRPTTGANFDRFVEYLKGQLKEIVINYHPGVMWFDGEWEPTWTHDRGEDLYRYVRSLDPAIMINNRVDKGRSGMQGMNTGKEFLGDFGTPEQEIPAQGFKDGRLWESCMTMNDTWGYARNDNNWKSADTLIHNLVDIASKGGNYLLNVGPTDLGEFPEAINERLAAIGHWIDVNGECIYATTASPFKKLPFDGRCTTKGNRLYLEVFHWPDQGLRLDGLKTRVVSARALAGNQPLRVKRPAGGEGVVIEVPRQVDPYATVVELKLAGKPEVSEAATTAIRPAADGSIALGAADAEIHGQTAQYESAADHKCIGFWTDKDDFVTWDVQAPAEGMYAVELTYACENGTGGSKFSVGTPGATCTSVVEPTGSWLQFKTVKLGSISLHPGKNTIAVRPMEKPGFAVMNLREVKLTPVK